MQKSKALSQSLFIQACHGKKLPRPPVWLMRQAGRYLPQYQAIRAKVDFLTLCKTPELAAEVSIQPVDILEVDAAIIFSDILVVLEAMGVPIHFDPENGPKIPKTIYSAADIEKLQSTRVAESLGYVAKAIGLVGKILTPRGIPVIGFAGAPFTLACYLIEGETSREFNKTKRFMNESPKAFILLLEKLAMGVKLFLEMQIQAGAAAVQLFDTWGGILSQEAYQKFALPALQQIVQPLKKFHIPIILYINGSTPHLESMRESGAHVLSVDWRLPLSVVRKRVGKKVCLQGNLDPTTLYAHPRVIAKTTHAMLADHPGPGLIANLGHGVLPDIPLEHVQAFVRAVKEFRTSEK